jgi:NAD+ diphosphatase
MSQDFISRIAPPEALESPALWFVFFENQLLLYKENFSQPMPEFMDMTELKAKVLFKQYLGIWQQKHCFCVEIESYENLPKDLIWQPLRTAALHFLSNDLFQLAGRALQILQWDKNHQFCGRCGNGLTASKTERAKICEPCHLSHYPRISPCIIVLIRRGREILLARSSHFAEGVYSTLAGFIEPGENAEQAAQREVYEEVGIKIKNLQYHFSQPWPFPDSLMLGFTAEHAAGEIMIDGVEIEDAGWFTIENLPSLPAPISIARKLIELFIHKEF